MKVYLLPLLLILTGCSSQGVVVNKPLTGAAPEDAYSIRNGANSGGSGKISLTLAFSGGGTRAAALAYGVMLELRDTEINVAGEPHRLLDEVDMISSVSGGSFTSAYYGLYGERLFEDFEDDFLRRDVQGTLVSQVLNPLHWLSNVSRTERAIEYYQDTVFHDATFVDMKRPGAPLVLINASDLGYGVRFSFTQEYFNLLCSEIDSFPVARAVTASSAVPVVFDPVALQNFDDCKHTRPAWLHASKKMADSDPQLELVVEGLSTYFDKDERRYAHMVDGGITDNLGLRAIYEIVEVTGGPRRFLERVDRKPPARMVIISVNASTAPEPKMDVTADPPSLDETVGAVTDIQLHRYNAATLELLGDALESWSAEMSTPGKEVKPTFIKLGFRDIEEPDRVRFFNTVPTSFRLTDEQVDRLIDAGRRLLRENEDYQQLLAELKEPGAAAQ